MVFFIFSFCDTLCVPIYYYVLSGLALLPFYQVFSSQEINEPVSREKAETNQGKFIWKVMLKR